MDLVVAEGSRIARLPRAARLPALVVRNLRDHAKRAANALVLKPLYGFGYNSDGLATAHYSPFLEDAQFATAYRQTIAWWWHGRSVDVRWRMWILTQCAKHCQTLPGAFVEFGVYRGGCAFMILTLADLIEGRQFYLFDTFGGVPETNLSETERQAGFAGRLADTSIEHILKVLAPWDLTTHGNRRWRYLRDASQNGDRPGGVLSPRLECQRADAVGIGIRLPQASQLRHDRHGRLWTT
jgi:hypothetical protein